MNWDIEGRLTCDLSTADVERFLQEDRDRNPLSRLKLQVRVDGRVVRVKVDPAHGHQSASALEQVKSSFKHALRNGQAYPECDVEWLH